MPGTWTGLVVALLAIVPGFLATTTWSRARTWKGPSGDLRTILQSLALSAAIQVLISPLTVTWIVPIRDHLAAHAGRVATWFFLTVLVLPIALGVLTARVTDLIFKPSTAGPTDNGWLTKKLDWAFKAPVPPSGWDWLFTSGPLNGKFVLVQLKNGSHIGGVFAQGSIALTSPEPQSLFLADEWVVDENGDFTVPLPGSRGVLIPQTSDIQWVRILEGAPDPDTGA